MALPKYRPEKWLLKLIIEMLLTWLWLVKAGAWVLVVWAWHWGSYLLHGYAVIPLLSIDDLRLPSDAAD